MTRAASAPRRVSTAEAALLGVARALVSEGGHASIDDLLLASLEPGDLETIGATAMDVLKRTLAVGSVKTLARLGGARPRARPTAGGRDRGRVFDAHAGLELAFGPYTFELLRWLTVTPLGPQRQASGPRLPEVAAAPVTGGDELCAYLALRLVAGGRFERAVASQPGLRAPLTWLGFPRALARWGAADLTPSLDGVLATEDRRAVLDCLGGDLSRRWLAASAWEAADVIDPELAVRIGVAERASLAAFLDEVEGAARWELATFLVDAGVSALRRGPSPGDVASRAAPRVHGDGTLRARTDARRKAGALFHALARVGKKREALALVRFIDDDYEAAQAILQAWEPLGRDGFARAGAVVSALEALEGPEELRGEDAGGA